MASEVERDEMSDTRFSGVVMGLLLGGGVGWTLAGLEFVIVALLTDDLPTGEALLSVMKHSALWGVVVGGATGVSGWQGARWSAYLSVVVTGWTLGVVVSDLGLGAGLHPVLAPLIGVGLAFLGGWIPAQGIATGRGLMAMTVGLLAACACLGAVHGHLVPGFGPMTGALDVIALLAACFLGGLGGLVGGTGSIPRVIATFVGLACLGWGGVWWIQDTKPLWIPSEPSLEARPVVCITVRGLRADRASSPVIQELASKGIVYQQAYSGSGWPLSASASLLSGRLPSEHSAGINLGYGASLRPIRADVPTIPDVDGRLSGAVVSSPFSASRYGLDRGFDYYDDRQEYGVVPHFLSPFFALGRPEGRSAEQVTDAALRFVTAQRGTRWLLWVEYSDLAEGAVEDDPQNLQAIDAAIGRLLAKVPKATVILTSDMGVFEREQRSEQANLPHHARAGSALYDEILHVPLILAGPGIAHKVVDRPVSTLDVAPSVAKFAGQELPGELLVEWVGGETSPDRTIVSEGVGYGAEMQAARRGEWKVLRSAAGWRLYHLTEDPRELNALHDSSALGTANELILKLPRLDAPSRGSFGPFRRELAVWTQRVRRDRSASEPGGDPGDGSLGQSGDR